MSRRTGLEVGIEDHPRLIARLLETRFPAGLDGMRLPPALAHLLEAGAETPFQPEEPLRKDVREMLRQRGYKPTGRGKPASEYLVRAASEGPLPSINPAVDLANAASLHSGFPISVVDVERLLPPLRISTAPKGEGYVFNQGGQVIEVAGLPCLYDAEGPCANAVRDAQRTKTGGATRHTLTVVWGVAGWEERLDRLVQWYRSLLESIGAQTREAGPHVP
jgi:DNA/RNA-binding domain of Phe-tRNA-synthetase-like protein